MLHTVKYLLYNGIESIEDKYGLKIRNYDDEGIMILNYSMIDSPKFDPVIRECRSLILTNAYPYRVISRSFDRFYNYTECPDSNDFNFSKSIVLDKIDGSLINIYYYNDRWNISTKGTAFAEAETPSGVSFKDLVLSVFDIDILNNSLNPFGVDNKHFTFIFEVVSPYNRIVTPYKETDIYLLGVRHKESGEEYNANQLQLWANTLGVKTPDVFPLTKYDDLTDRFKDVSAFTEGYVCIDYSNGYPHRLKIKNPAYVNIHHLRDNGALSAKRVANLVWDNEEDEYLSYFPEDRQFFQPYINARTKLIINIKRDIIKYENIDDQKDFAIAIKDIPHKSFLFSLRQGKTLSNIFDKATSSTKLSMLNNYIEE